MAVIFLQQVLHSRPGIVRRTYTVRDAAIRAVRLDEAQTVLLVAERVETALSTSEALGLPAWAALTATNLERFTPPPSVTRLTIARDADPAGEAAAHSLQVRLSPSLTVELAPSPEGFNDWNAWVCRKT